MWHSNKAGIVIDKYPGLIWDENPNTREIANLFQVRRKISGHLQLELFQQTESASCKADIYPGACHVRLEIQRLAFSPFRALSVPFQR